MLLILFPLSALCVASLPWMPRAYLTRCIGLWSVRDHRQSGRPSKRSASSKASTQKTSFYAGCTRTRTWRTPSRRIPLRNLCAHSISGNGGSWQSTRELPWMISSDWFLQTRSGAIAPRVYAAGLGIVVTIVVGAQKSTCAGTATLNMYLYVPTNRRRPPRSH